MKEIKKVTGRAVLEELLAGKYILNNLNNMILKFEDDKLLSATLKNKRWNIFHTHLTTLLEGDFTVIEEPFKTIRDLSIGDKFWFITITGKIDSKTWQGTEEDTLIRESGNAFLNKSMLHKELDRRIKDSEKRVNGELF